MTNQEKKWARLQSLLSFFIIYNPLQDNIDTFLNQPSPSSQPQPLRFQAKAFVLDRIHHLGARFALYYWWRGARESVFFTHWMKDAYHLPCCSWTSSHRCNLSVCHDLPLRDLSNHSNYLFCKWLHPTCSFPICHHSKNRIEAVQHRFYTTSSVLIYYCIYSLSACCTTTCWVGIRILWS